MKVALYSTVFPAVLPFVGSWYHSVLRQEDQAFTVHLALDGVSPADVAEAVGGTIEAEFTTAARGDTPALVRQRAWTDLCDRFDLVVMVDADDVLHPSRVAGAIQALESADVDACALRLVDREGRPLGATLGPGAGRTMGDCAAWLPYRNLFGLSNTAYRTDYLRRWLPLPPDITAVDWYLATRACWDGATLTFDPVPRMDYRQHGRNIGRVLPPFDGAYLERATEVVLRHQQALLSLPLDAAGAAVRRGIARRVAEVKAFSDAMRDATRRSDYLEAINEPRRAVYAWWEVVAMPELETLWTNEVERTWTS